MQREIVSLVLTVSFISSCVALTNEKAVDLFYPDDIKPEFVNACFGQYGCFNTGPPFYDEKYRPITVPPANNTVTIYNLFTPKNVDVAYDLKITQESIKNSKFNPKVPTKVIIHGLQIKNLTSFMKMKDAFLEKIDANVIVVDWTHDNSFPVYQAIANARLTAAKVAHLLEALMKEYPSLKAEDIHVIGHSLGGQLSGWVGERIKNLGRISGLDPGGPYFHHAPKEVHIDATDANFVDIIHTNGGYNVTEGIGIAEESGDIDFYPNGGNEQPGCEDSNVISDAPTEEVANTCSHNRAIYLYTSSIKNMGNKKCLFTARQADSWEDFKNNKKNDHGVYNNQFNNMGYLARFPTGLPPNNARFYLRTSDTDPYCLLKGFIPN